MATIFSSSEQQLDVLFCRARDEAVAGVIFLLREETSGHNRRVVHALSLFWFCAAAQQPFVLNV